MRTKKRKAQWKMEGEAGMPRLEWAVRRGQPARGKGASKKSGGPKVHELSKHECDLRGLRGKGTQKEAFMDWRQQK